MSKRNSKKAVAFEISGFAVLMILIIYVIGYWAVSQAPGQGGFAFIVGAVAGTMIPIGFWVLDKFTGLGKKLGWK